MLVLVLGVSGRVMAQGSNDHIFPAAVLAKPSIDFDSKGFLVHGKRTFLVSAGIEYARVPRALWTDRLLRLQRAGFNCVEVYTFWNFHESREGVFNFTGDHDLGAFLKLVKAMGMYAIVRVGPYYCAEWDNGGYPLWLRFKPGLRVREPNAVFEHYAGLFFDRLLPVVAANQIDRGGAVILVQLENEHPAGWGTAMPNAYFRWLRKKALAGGIRVPYFFSGLHHASDPAGDALSLDDPGRPNPWLSTEFWSVWYDGYGSGEKEARLYERRTWKIIAHGGNGYNYYMAHGGSNFGYTNNDEDAASYDYGAAVGQGGDLRPIYYAFKRAALFARSFAGVLENSVDAAADRSADSGIRVNARKGPSGEIDFYDNHSGSAVRMALSSGDTLSLAPGEIFPLVKHYEVSKGMVLTGNTLRILGIVRQGAGTTLLAYGAAGSRGKLHFSTGELDVVVPEGRGVNTYRIGGLRVLVMNGQMADRSWVVDADGATYIVCGPRYVGTFEGGKLETEGGEDADIYTATDVRRFAGRGVAPPMNRMGVVGGWRKSGGSAAAGVGYDDRGWKLSERPLQMGADGDTTADCWYRVHVTVAEDGDYTLLVEGTDRARAFIDGVPAGSFAIREGAIPLHLTKGGHLLAVFTAHDGRDKLPAYLGPLDSVARKGLFGRALLVKGVSAVQSLHDWRLLKADSNGVVPAPEAAGWKPYTIGEDAFDKRQGYGWFQTVLPALQAGVKQAELRFSSVDENATVFLNGRRVARHEGWNVPFSVLIDRVDTFRQPVVLTLLVENYSNEGGIDQPVRFSQWVSPVAVTEWRMRGGPLKDLSGDDSTGPCWWQASFRLPADSGYRPVWRVMPRGLGHGSIWVNGHNLGRYPEKIPVNGLYIPECWLKEGKNDLTIYEEDGRDARQVSVEAEEGASRRVDLLSAAGPWSFVNPWVGTTPSAVPTHWGNEGGTYPGAVAVSGYMQLTPETRIGATRGYDYNDSLIYVFSCRGHHSGFPGGSAGRLFVMPVSEGKGMAGRPFSHGDEQAEPGYYRVRLSDDGTVVEATAGALTGEIRIWFGGNAPAIFIGDTAGSAFTFSEPYTGRRETVGGTVYTFAARMVVVKVGTVKQDFAFDSLRAAARGQWERTLGVVEVESDNAREKTVFYTALYHSLLLPWITGEKGGYGGFSPWDSFRSLHPLLTLLYPDKQSAILQSLLEDYRKGGYLPVESMTGDHSIPIIVDAYLKGIRGIDKYEAYAAMLKSLVKGPFLQADRAVYAEKGYIPFTYPESVTRTVEYGYDDWVLAQYAKEVMGDMETYRRLVRGGEAWRRLLYVPELLLLPRDGDSFRVRPGHSGYKEGDAWAYSYFAPQDVTGLIDRMGGNDFFAARLDSALRDGRIVFDNETVLQVPYLFSAAGRTDLTQRWVREIMTRRYSDEPGGLPGNDDLGAMSSWYVFSALGFFPVCPGRPFYTIGAPLFRRVLVRLPGGKQLVITGSGRTEDCYVRSILFDEKPYRSAELSHALLLRGGTLAFRLDALPGKALETGRRGGPRIGVTAMTVSRQKLAPGELGWVKYTLQNSGDTGTIRLSLMADRKQVNAKNSLVAAGAVAGDSMSFELYRLGKIALKLGGEVVQVEIRRPEGPLPTLPETEALEVKALVRGGDSATIRYTLKNTGWEARTYSVPIRVDDEVVAVDTLALEPGEQKERSFVWKADKVGWRVWRIGGLARRCRVYTLPEEAVVLDGGEPVGDTLLPDGSGWGNILRVAGKARPGEGRGILVGSEDYLWAAGSRSLDDLGERLTMSVWVYPRVAAGPGLIDIFTNGDTHVLQIAGGRSLTFFAGGWGRGDCTVDLPVDWVGHWHYLAGVCDGGGLRLYVDGQLRGYTPMEKSVHLIGGGNTWMVGRNEEFPGQRIFEGRVDRPMLFQEALSAETIYNIYIKDSKRL